VDGQWIFFYTDVDGRHRICKIPAEGGALFVITDHMPDPGAIKDLAFSFGIEVSNGYVMKGPPPGRAGPTLFRKTDGSLADHPLTKGRGSGEHVRRVATFAGSAFRCEEGFQPLLILGEGFRSWMPEEYNKFPPGTPNIDVAGWYKGGVRTYGEGRIAFFAEAAMFTAQIFANGRVKAGMNHPLGQDNARLLLNILHLLSGIKDREADPPRRPCGSSRPRKANQDKKTSTGVDARAGK